MTYDKNQVYKQWMVLHEKEVLSENETARAVYFENDRVYTTKEKIQSIDDLYSILDRKYAVNSNFGISASAAEFRFDTDKSPSQSTFLRTKALVFDVDAYVGESKKRIRLKDLETEWQEVICAGAHAALCAYMKASEIEWPMPQLMGVTGGGVQMIYKFNRYIDYKEAKTIADYFKRGLPDKRIIIHAPTPVGGTYRIELEFDSTSLDPTHVQRVFGSINPKYDVMATLFDYTDPILFSSKVQRTIYDYGDYFTNESARREFMEKYNKIIPLIDSAFRQDLMEFKTEEILPLARIIQTRPVISHTGMNKVEYTIASQLNEGRGFDLVRDQLTIFNENSNIVAIKCPFHDGDSHSSFAVYKNVGSSPDIFMDFHDQEKYNIVEFYAALFNISKSQAINEIVQQTGIKINIGEKKDLRSLEATEEAEELLHAIMAETHYVYYRLSNRQKICIARNTKTGQVYQFDGVRALARHLLQDKTKIKVIDKEFLFQFTDLLESHYLIDGFERFEPGKSKVFEDDKVSIVNTWIETDAYREVMEVAKSYDELDLEQAKELMKEKTYYSYFYIHQLVQYGDLDWFINWLAMTVQFITTPTVPVCYGTFGTGKNVFVDYIMRYFLNDEYVHVINTESITKNFNAFMESASLVVLDEGNLYDGQAVDALKLLSGNRKIKIERKGVDVQEAIRHFNFLMFSNRETPSYITAQERRFSFFNSTIPLPASVHHLKDVSDIEELIENIQLELPHFFAILYKLQIDKRWSNMNTKDGTFWRVLLSGHTFGKLILTIMDNNWDSLALQLSENISDNTRLQIALDILFDLRNSFEQKGELPLTLINRYIESLNYKNRSSAAEFIRINQLSDIGINVKVNSKEVYVKIDIEMLKVIISNHNVLYDILPDLDESHDKRIVESNTSEPAKPLTVTTAPAIIDIQ
jgi:hypothetical protein